MAENVYEGMFMLDANRYGRDPESVSGQIPKMIEKAGGQLLVSRLWEERRLAYPIQGHRKAAYWLTYFRIEGRELAGLEQKCRLSDSVLRVLFLKVDPRIVDTLVEHARGGPAKPTRHGSQRTGGKQPDAKEGKEPDVKDGKEPDAKEGKEPEPKDDKESAGEPDKSESEQAETPTAQP